jgi:acylphosphatase
MTRHFNITVKGKVQGVYFRASAKQMADLLGIKGFARNEPNNDVYIEAEGEEDMLVNFTHWCHHGPTGAAVQNVSVSEAEMQNFGGFEVRR